MAGNVPPTLQVHSVSEHLEKLSREFVTAINSRDWESEIWRQRVAQSFSTANHVLGFRENITGRQKLLDEWKNFSSDCPEVHINVRRVEVSVWEEGGKNAHVFLHNDLTGCPPGISRPGVTRLEFRLMNDQKWKLVQHEVLHGIDVFAQMAQN